MEGREKTSRSADGESPERKRIGCLCCVAALCRCLLFRLASVLCGWKKKSRISSPAQQSPSSQAWPSRWGRSSAPRTRTAPPRRKTSSRRLSEFNAREPKTENKTQVKTLPPLPRGRQDWRRVCATSRRSLVAACWIISTEERVKVWMPALIQRLRQVQLTLHMSKLGDKYFSRGEALRRPRETPVDVKDMAKANKGFLDRFRLWNVDPTRRPLSERTSSPSQP